VTRNAVTEGTILRCILKRTSENGIRLFRNNCGQAMTSSGQTIRYGIANPGGADLIGLTPVVIGPSWVGSSVAIFTAIEVKRQGYYATELQKRFLNFVTQYGGIATESSSADDALAFIHDYINRRKGK
jgi:hypothetical protein